MHTATRLIAPSLLLALVGCGAGEVREVGSYDAIDNESDVTVRMSDDAADGNPETVEVECDVGNPNVIEIVTAEDGGNNDEDASARLTIRADGDVEDCQVLLDAETAEEIRVTGNGDLTISGTSTSLTDLMVAGSGDVMASTIEVPRFRLDSTGSGSIAIDELMVNELTLEMTGSSEATLGGEATVGDVLLDGTVVLYGEQLTFGELDIEMSGDSTAEVTVTDDIDADLSGSAILEVWGPDELDIADVEYVGDSSFVLN